MSETDVMHDIMIEATRLGHRLLRNNVGVATYKDEEGNVTGKVAYGVGGVGAGDLVGWTQRTFWVSALPIEGAALVMKTIPVFTMIETKKPKGKTAKKRLAEQTRKIEAVKQAGGIAGFCDSVAAYRELVR
jgi:hypothetical protein